MVREGIFQRQIHSIEKITLSSATISVAGMEMFGSDGEGVTRTEMDPNPVLGSSVAYAKVLYHARL